MIPESLSKEDKKTLWEQIITRLIPGTGILLLALFIPP
jgi:hypothetical protein